MSLIDISDADIGYDTKPVLTDVNLVVQKDDFLGVIGPNGGGKTTLIKAMLGIIKPMNGKISYGEHVCHAGRPAIGYLPQQEKFDPAFPISVREVILSGLQSGKRLWNRYTSADRKEADKLIEMTGIKAIAQNAISEVSGGQMQRALLCRAIISQPKLLILDEPANFVDSKFEKELYDILRRLNENMAIIMVSHDLGTISSVVKNIVCVNRHVHRHDSNRITAEQLKNYDCPSSSSTTAAYPTPFSKHIEQTAPQQATRH